MNNKINRLKYYKFVIVTSVVLAVGIVLVILFNNFLKIELTGFFYGIIISYANFLIGLIILLNALNKEGAKFFLIVFGSLVARLFLLLGFIVIGLLFFKFERFSFIFVFFSVYFLLLIAEIIFLLNVEKTEKIEDKKA